MMGALSNKDQVGFALLALWQLNDDPADRNLISAAALGTPDGAGFRALRTLALVDDEVRASVELIAARANASGDIELATMTNKIVGELPTTVQLDYLLSEIAKDDLTYAIDSDYSDRIIEIATSDEAARQHVAGKIEGDSPLNIYLRYVLYMAGDTARLDDILAPLAADPKLFDEIDYMLVYGDFAEGDEERVVTALLGYLGSVERDEISTTAISGLRRVASPAVSDAIRGTAVKWLAEAVLTPYGESWDYEPAAALIALASIDTTRALRVMGAAMSSEQRTAQLVDAVDQLLNQDNRTGIDKPAFKEQFAQLYLPNSDDSPAAWAEWLRDYGPPEPVGTAQTGP